MPKRKKGRLQTLTFGGPPKESPSSMSPTKLYQSNPKASKQLLGGGRVRERKREGEGERETHTQHQSSTKDKNKEVKIHIKLMGKKKLRKIEIETQMSKT